MTLDMEEVDLLDIVDETLESMACLFENRHVQLITDLDSSIVEADPFKIGMVITNFIGNALHHSESGEKVIIHLDEHCFSVENTGAYIPEEDIEKIWLSFHKVDKARNEGGTGLGLAICKAILELHHFEYGSAKYKTGCFILFSFLMKPMVEKLLVFLCQDLENMTNNLNENLYNESRGGKKWN